MFFPYTNPRLIKFLIIKKPSRALTVTYDGAFLYHTYFENTKHRAICPLIFADKDISMCLDMDVRLEPRVLCEERE